MRFRWPVILVLRDVNNSEMYFLQVAFNRVARGMLHSDHITFAMLLAKINLKGMTR